MCTDKVVQQNVGEWTVNLSWSFLNSFVWKFNGNYWSNHICVLTEEEWQCMLLVVIDMWMSFGCIFYLWRWKFCNKTVPQSWEPFTVLVARCCTSRLFTMTLCLYSVMHLLMGNEREVVKTGLCICILCFGWFSNKRWNNQVTFSVTYGLAIIQKQVCIEKFLHLFYSTRWMNTFFVSNTWT